MTIIITNDEIRLPKSIAKKYRGKKVEVVDTGEGVLLKPVEDTIALAKGYLKKIGYTSETYFSQKQADKHLDR